MIQGRYTLYSIIHTYLPYLPTYLAPGYLDIIGEAKTMYDLDTETIVGSGSQVPDKHPWGGDAVSLSAFKPLRS